MRNMGKQHSKQKQKSRTIKLFQLFNAKKVRLSFLIALIVFLSIFSMVLASLQLGNQWSDTAKAGLSCPTGTTLSTTTQTCQQLVSKICPTNGTLQNNGTCTVPTYTCPKGGSLSGTTCTASTSNYVIPDTGCYLGGTPEDWWCGYYFDTIWVDIGRGQCPGVDAFGTNMTDNFIQVTQGPYTGSIICGRAGARWGYVGGSPIYGGYSYTASASSTNTTTTATCPANYSNYNQTQCIGGASTQPTGYIIDSAAVGTGTCTPSSVDSGIAIPSCTFPLTGSTNGQYTIPTGGLYAGILNIGTDTSSYIGNSNACTVSGAVLTCTMLPTTNASLGNKTVVIHESTTTFYPNKGTVSIIVSYEPPTTITMNRVGDSTDCIVTKNVAVGDTYSCTFPLSGVPNFTFQLPTEGMSAATSQNNGTDLTPLATGFSPACSIINNGMNNQVALLCNGIPSLGGTAGSKNVLLRIGTTNPVDKGDVTLIVNPTTIGANNIGNSTDCVATKSVTIPDTYSCTFPLSGNTNNTYTLPSGGLSASTQGATGQTSACTIVGNGTSQAAITCSSIPTAGSTSGSKNVLLKIGSTDPINKGIVNLSIANTLVRTGGINLILIAAIIGIIGVIAYASIATAKSRALKI